MGMIFYKDRYFHIPDREKLVAYYRETGLQKKEL